MSRGMARLCVLLSWVAWCGAAQLPRADLRVVRQWAELDIAFPSEEARAAATANGFYRPGASVPIDVDVQYVQGNRTFITIPRFGSGVPVTLGTVDDAGRLSAYPDYSWHDNQGSNCDGLTSVFRIAMDNCNRLWVMDTGVIARNQVCSPQLLAFDLATDQLIFRHRVSASNYNANSQFVNTVVDIRSEDCSDAFVYAADNRGFGILAVDVANNRSTRVDHRLFYPFPSRGSFTIDGESFDLMDGILGMAISPVRGQEDRNLYFHALSATTENVIKTEFLRNATATGNSYLAPESIDVFSGERPNQSAAEAIDRDGIMYFGLMEPPSIYCWNTATEFKPSNFHPISINRETLQFASGIKVIDNAKGEQELWVLNSSFQRVMSSSLTSDRINFRVNTGEIDRLLVGSPCRQTTRA